MKLFSRLAGLIGLVPAGCPSTLEITRQTTMRCPPKILSCLCLLALLFCQLAAALDACGAAQPTRRMDAAQAMLTPPCHGSGKDTARCDASSCVVGQALQDGTGTAFVALPIEFKHFEWEFDRIEVRIAPMSARSREPGYPPPHFLGQLLI